MGAVKFDVSCSLGALRVEDPSGTWDCQSSIGWLVVCHQLMLGTGWSFLQRYHRGCLTDRKNLRSSVLTVGLFTEPSTLLFLCTENPLLFSLLLSHQCLEPFG